MYTTIVNHLQMYQIYRDYCCILLLCKWLNPVIEKQNIDQMNIR